METKTLLIFTRTPLHIGAGESVGAIDQPVIRERHTGFPIIPGSSIKGVLRDAFHHDETLKNHEKQIFGEPTDAGKLTIGEAKILAFPVRSAKGSFALITCPLVLERFRRVLENNLPPIEEPNDLSCFAGSKVLLEREGHAGVVLEEYRFSKATVNDGKFPVEWENYLIGLIDDPVWKAGKGRFVLLSNGDFAHFVKNACEISQHVCIDPEKGVAKKGALFNIEAIPSETMFFSTINTTERSRDEIKKLTQLIDSKPILQFGGDSTTGLGFCSVKLK